MVAGPSIREAIGQGHNLQVQGRYCVLVYEHGGHIVTLEKQYLYGCSGVEGNDH